MTDIVEQAARKVFEHQIPLASDKPRDFDDPKFLYERNKAFDTAQSLVDAGLLVDLSEIKVHETINSDAPYNYEVRDRGGHRARTVPTREERTRMNISEFLLARIDEEETKAQQLFDDLSNQIRDEKLRPDDRGPYTPTRLLKSSMWAQYDGQTRWRNFARGQNIAYLADPARVLAECEAKRTIIALHDQSGQRWEGFPRADTLANYCTHDQHPAPCNTIRTLAAVHSDHPDYLEEWHEER